MTSTLLVGAGRLCVARPAGTTTPMTLSPWAVQVVDGRVAWVGDPSRAPGAERRVDLGTALVTPGLVDSHTHPVFAGDRSDETAARLAGRGYDGGGILRTVAATRAAADDDLERLVEERLRAALGDGTTTIETKSGYGLSLEEELRALRILGRVAERLPLRVRRTFLGAHAVPPEAPSAAGYVDHVVDEMLPAAAAGEAEGCDVFCDAGFFTVDDARRILRAARALGLAPRIHAEQLARTGAAELAIEVGALSADHLEQLDEAGVRAFAASRTVATLLPGPALLMGGRLPPARALVDAGATIALASDANAGTFGSISMPLTVGLGAALLRLTAEEALTAATWGGAMALGVGERIGLVAAGYEADLVAWNAEHEGAFALQLGAVRPHRTWIAGDEVL